MLYLVIFMFCLVLFIFLILILKAKVVIEYLRNGYDDHFVLSFFTLKGIIKYKYEIPLIDLENTGIEFQRVSKKGKKEREGKKRKSLLGFYEAYIFFKKSKEFYHQHKVIICKIRDYIRKRITLKEFELKVEIGTGDSFQTGLITGFIWIAAGILISFLSNTFKTFKKNINIDANFSESKFNVDLYCIFSVRFVHIIIVVLMLTLNKRSIRKNSKQIIGGGINA